MARWAVPGGDGEEDCKTAGLIFCCFYGMWRRFAWPRCDARMARWAVPGGDGKGEFAIAHLLIWRLCGARLRFAGRFSAQRFTRPSSRAFAAGGFASLAAGLRQGASYDRVVTRAWCAGSSLFPRAARRCAAGLEARAARKRSRVPVRSAPLRRAVSGRLPNGLGSRKAGRLASRFFWPRRVFKAGEK